MQSFIFYLTFWDEVVNLLYSGEFYVNHLRSL